MLEIFERSFDIYSGLLRLLSLFAWFNFKYIEKLDPQELEIV